MGQIPDINGISNMASCFSITCFEDLTIITKSKEVVNTVYVRA